MSTVYPTIDGFVGYGTGLEAQLRSEAEWDSAHPLVVERPELFTEPETTEPVVQVVADPGLHAHEVGGPVKDCAECTAKPAAPRRGRPPGSKNKPKADASG